MIERFGATLKLLMASPQFVVSVACLSIIGFLTLFGPLLTPWEPWQIDATKRFAGPSAQHWFGNDEFGRDIFSLIVHGAQISLVVSVFSMIFASVVGAIIGMVAGYYRGAWEVLAMRGTDIMLCFPPMLMAIFLVALTGPSITNLVFVIGILFIPRFARIAYSSTLSVAEIQYVEGARAIGARNWFILLRHILPNILAPLFVQFSLGLGSAILIESGLSFLGLGPPPPAASWGRMISTAQRFLSMSPYGVLWPSIFISVTVIAVNLLGDALRDTLDPRVRNRMK
ncbi:ABC transporter permease [Nitratireductor sp.]|uniref:ABC transporter permease n=1 Tax=Nitratireductor sp. TaxID=1872084 RepID=UPI0026150BE5|nr:ABC transporter permease [Nitratireductor sp.]MCV0378354.1 ABC transporter permease [Nitratireductor sp.]